MDVILDILKSPTRMKNLMSFWLTLTSLIGFFALSFTKDVDVTVAIPMVLGIFVTGRAAERAVAIRSAMSDPDADTHQVIRDLEGIAKPDAPE